MQSRRCLSFNKRKYSSVWRFGGRRRGGSAGTWGLASWGGCKRGSPWRRRAPLQRKLQLSLQQFCCSASFRPSPASLTHPPIPWPATCDYLTCGIRFAYTLSDHRLRDLLYRSGSRDDSFPRYHIIDTPPSCRALAISHTTAAIWRAGGRCAPSNRLRKVGATPKPSRRTRAPQ